MSNSNLQWEKTQQIDFGVELGLFQNRISFELDLYRRKVNEMLLDAPLPSSSGYTSIYTNVGSMENKGVEFAVNSTNIKAGDFSWSTTFNISVNKNKVLALSGGSDIFSGATVIRVGEPVGSFFGRVHQGIWSTAEAEQAKK
jgi:outer membrane cobalamin receptor